MTSNFFPMLSSSPPPLDDECPDNEDEDDEFGTFTSASIGFDSSFDSPVSGEKSTTSCIDTLKNDFNKEKLNNLESSSSFIPDEEEENVGQKVLEETYDAKSELFEDKHFLSHKLLYGPKQNFVVDNISDTSASQNSLIRPSYNNEINKIQRTCENGEELSCYSTYDSISKNCAIPTVCNSLPNSLEKYNEDENIAFSSDSSTYNDVTQTSEESHTLKNVCDVCLSNINDDTKSLEICSCVKSIAKENCILISNSCEPDTNLDEAFDENILKHDQLPFNESSSYKEFVIETNTSNIDSLSHKVISELSSSIPTLSNHLDETSNICISSELSPVSFTDNFNFPPPDEIQNEEMNHKKENSENIPMSEQEKFNDFRNYSQVFNNFKSDEFDDFQESKNCGSLETDDFADFEAAVFVNHLSFDKSDSCEFSEFEKASFDSVPLSSYRANSSCAPLIQEHDKGNDKLLAVIKKIFPLHDASIEDKTEEFAFEILEQNNKSRRLWEKLHEIEQSPGLRFQWGVSHSFQQLLRSVNVDYHSILRTSSVPIFASGLSLLEPLKGSINSTDNQDLEERNQSPRDPIPPVEFDWNSSGLVNPLDSSQTASTLMDFSFLSSAEATSLNSYVTVEHSLENELLKSSCATDNEDNSSKNIILEQLLSKNISSLPNSNKINRLPSLSEEAIHLLDQLPDLSFMKAKVLMFPVYNKT